MSESDQNSDQDSSWPENLKHKRLKMWTNIITTSAALALAVFSVVRNSNTASEEAVYKELSSHINTLNEEIKNQREDINSLRSYIDIFLRSTSVVGPQSQNFGNSDSTVILIPIDKNKVRQFSNSNAQPILLLPSTVPPAMPLLHQSYGPIKILQYEEIIKNTKK